MNSRPNYVAEIQSTCIPDEQHVSGDVSVDIIMYPDTSCSSGTQSCFRATTDKCHGITVFFRAELLYIADVN